MRTALETKLLLNPKETIQLYSLNVSKFCQLIRSEKKLPFMALYNKRRLIIRTEFEKYLEENPNEKERLVNGKRTVKEKRL